MSRQQRKELFAAFAFLSPALIFNALFLAFPVIGAMLLSISDVNRITLETHFVGLENFYWIATDPGFYTTIGNTLVFVSMSVAGNVLLGLTLAVMLDRSLPEWMLYFFRLAYFMPVLVSLAFVSYIWEFFYSTDLGVLNYYITSLGLPRIGWLTNEDIAIASIAILDVWKHVGFYMIIFLAALQGVPKNIIEAATIDGAKPFIILIKVKLYFVMPIMVFCIAHATIHGLQIFDSIRLLTNGGPGDSTRSMVLYMFGEAFGAGELGAGAATALVLLVMIGAVVSLQLFAGRRISI